jgi:hypothetical protein
MPDATSGDEFLRLHTKVGPGCSEMAGESARQISRLDLSLPTAMRLAVRLLVLIASVLGLGVGFAWAWDRSDARAGAQAEVASGTPALHADSPAPR